MLNHIAIAWIRSTRAKITTAAKEITAQKICILASCWSARVRRTPAFSQIVRQSHLIGKHSFFFFAFSFHFFVVSFLFAVACVCKSLLISILFIFICVRGYFSSFLVDIVYRIADKFQLAPRIPTRSLWVAHSHFVAWARYFPRKR